MRDVLSKAITFNMLLSNQQNSEATAYRPTCSPIPRFRVCVDRISLALSANLIRGVHSARLPRHSTVMFSGSGMARVCNDRFRTGSQKWPGLPRFFKEAISNFRLLNWERTAAPTTEDEARATPIWTMVGITAAKS